jgi:hypothetical protein
MELIQAITMLKTIRETNFSENLQAGKERNQALDIAISELEKQQSEIKWIPITSGLPPIGEVLIVTIFDSFRQRNELRYPVYYRKSYYSDGYGFYQYGVEENILLPEFSEVLAWMPIPKMWKGERSCK